MGHRILYIPKPVNPIFYPEYGLLYNWWVTQGTGDASLTSSDDWVVPNNTQFNILISELGDSTVAGKHIKEDNIIYWDTDNTGDNTSKFNAKGSGSRSGGTFSALKTSANFWSSFDYYWYPSVADQFAVYSSIDNFQTNNTIRQNGYSLRILKTSTSLSNGQSGTYTGNDGKTYRTICIGTQEWLADNLTETRFRNGDIIPWYGANPANYFTDAEWAALTTVGCCAYNNTLSNVGPGFSFPT